METNEARSMRSFKVGLISGALIGAGLGGTVGILYGLSEGRQEVIGKIDELEKEVRGRWMRYPYIDNFNWESRGYDALSDDLAHLTYFLNGSEQAKEKLIEDARVRFIPIPEITGGLGSGLMHKRQGDSK